ncbi:hypothetical protein POTOM_028302 [Populus tomentosa]|uniref:Uncharacterized protein n=1 Tax=Populus tomentosa TaxID=118781 RepID=A0A8X7Z8T2_POPTO|nr:hypothetical protein POTOM_028302 [Populus tomentosa]
MSEETKSPDSTSLVTQPGIFSIGSSSVGKRTLLSSNPPTLAVRLLSSLVALENWVAGTDISNFLILLSSLLDDEEEPLREMKRSCIEWCTENGIEYIEACALDVDFDKLKRIHTPCPEISEESDYEFEYKVLSAGQLNHGTTHGGWSDEAAPFDFEDLEQLMSEIGNVRDSSSLMPDFQRRNGTFSMEIDISILAIMVMLQQSSQPDKVYIYIQCRKGSVLSLVQLFDHGTITPVC